MHKEYIDRERLKEAFHTDTEHLQSRDEALFELLMLEIDEVPAEDVAPVVRCKDCKHYGYDGLCKLHSEDADQFTTGYALAMDDEDYCSYGERNEA